MADELNIITSDVNSVSVTTEDRLVVVTNAGDTTNITIPQAEITTVQIASIGPQGPKGLDGQPGRDGLYYIDTGSMLQPYLLSSQTASFVTNNQTGSMTVGTASYYDETDPIYTAEKPTLATTGSNIFYGLQAIAGDYGTLVYGDYSTPGYDTLADIHAYNQTPWLERFYNDSFSTSSAVMAYFGWNDGRFIFHNESTQSISINVGSYDNNTGLSVYMDKVTFANNIEVAGGITGSLYNEAFSKNTTTNVSINTIKEYQTIFNPSNLFIAENDVFIVEENAEYYVLGDVINSGSIVVDGTFKIGGALLNTGNITGIGIIE